DAVRQRLVKAELLGVLRSLEAIEVEMRDEPAPSLVGLNQAEGRARHLLGDAERANEGAGKRRLAAAELTGKGNDIAGAGELGQGLGKRGGGGLVRQIEPKVDAAGNCVHGGSCTVSGCLIATVRLRLERPGLEHRRVEQGPGAENAVPPVLDLRRGN